MTTYANMTDANRLKAIREMAEFGGRRVVASEADATEPKDVWVVHHLDRDRLKDQLGYEWDPFTNANALEEVEAALVNIGDLELRRDRHHTHAALSGIAGGPIKGSSKAKSDAIYAVVVALNEREG